MPRDTRVCEAKKPTVLLSVILRISVLTGGDVAESQKMALNLFRGRQAVSLIFSSPLRLSAALAKALIGYFCSDVHERALIGRRGVCRQ